MALRLRADLKSADFAAPHDEQGLYAAADLGRSTADMTALIEAKKEKEAGRYIQRWDEAKISVENARWGPIIKFGKKTGTVS